jgi:predicted PurR-regulated permease PerM
MTATSRTLTTIFQSLVSAIAMVAILMLAKGFLIPLAFALLMSFILFPVVTRLERWGIHRMVAAFTSILLVLVLISLAILLFTTQIVALSRDFPDFQAKFTQILADVTVFINQNLNVVPDLKRNELLQRINAAIVSSSGTWFASTFSNVARFSASLILTVVYLFLILIYRTGLTKAFTRFFPHGQRERAMGVFISLQKVGQTYLFGVVMVIFIVGCLNSIGLWLIGIEHALLFGFIAATLTIIPYIGTLIGASLPMVYAFVTYESAGMAFSIAVFFWIVQLLESNLITPKIVGGNLQINALTSIMSIVIGATIWGIPGMILFLPFAAMLSVVCSEYEPLKPFGMLMRLRD